MVFLNLLSAAGEERVVKRSEDRVSQLGDMLRPRDLKTPPLLVLSPTNREDKYEPLKLPESLKTYTAHLPKQYHKCHATYFAGAI